MKALSRFVRSVEGRFYDLVCRQYGLDPGAPMTDDVEAFNLRAAFLVARGESEDEPVSEFEAAWRSGG